MIIYSNNTIYKVELDYSGSPLYAMPVDGNKLNFWIAYNNPGTSVMTMTPEQDNQLAIVALYRKDGEEYCKLFMCQVNNIEIVGKDRVILAKGYESKASLNNKDFLDTYKKRLIVELANEYKKLNNIFIEAKLEQIKSIKRKK